MSFVVVVLIKPPGSPMWPWPHHATELPGPLRSLDELLEEVLALAVICTTGKDSQRYQWALISILREELMRFGIDWDDIVLNESDCLGRQPRSELASEEWMHSCLR